MKRRSAKQTQVKNSAKNQARTNELFEIVAVIAIVLIVAVTGQVMVSYDKGRQGDLISGNVVSDSIETVETVTYNDLSVEKIDVNPPSPLIGQAIQVTVTIKNKGTDTITTPFYVEAKFTPKTEYGTLEPMSVPYLMSKTLAPGETFDAIIFATLFVPEGPVMITGTADATVKFSDMNPANNQMSKVVLVTNQ